MPRWLRIVEARRPLVKRQVCRVVKLVQRLAKQLVPRYRVPQVAPLTLAKRLAPQAHRLLQLVVKKLVRQPLNRERQRHRQLQALRPLLVAKLVLVTSPATDTSVLQKFFAASGVSQANGDSYLVTPKEDGSYQVEIRNNGGDPQVASLVGMYQYNPTTNQVQKMNIVTGQYE